VDEAAWPLKVECDIVLFQLGGIVSQEPQAVSTEHSRPCQRVDDGSERIKVRQRRNLFWNEEVESAQRFGKVGSFGSASGIDGDPKAVGNCDRLIQV